MFFPNLPAASVLRFPDTSSSIVDLHCFPQTISFPGVRFALELVLTANGVSAGIAA
jgi:hypothetical protein